MNKLYEDFLNFLLKQNTIYKFIVLQLYEDIPEIRSWLKLPESKHLNNVYAFSKSLGSIELPNEFNIDFFNSFMISRIEENKINYENFIFLSINYLIFLSRISNDNDQSLLEEAFINSLNNEDLNYLISIFIKWLNVEYLKDFESFNKNPNTVAEWQTLINQISYVSYFSDPVHIAISIIYYRPYFTYDVLIHSNPILKARIISYKNDLILDKAQIKELSKSKDVTFMCSITIGIQYHPLNFNLIDEEIWKEVLDKWDNNYLSSIHNLFGDYVLSEEPRLDYMRNLTKIIIEKYFKTCSNEHCRKPLENLQWPKDYVPFTYLLGTIQLSNEIEKVFIKSYSTKVSDYFDDILLNKIRFVFDNEYRFKKDFTNIFSAQECLTYTLYSCLKTDKLVWVKLLNSLRKVLMFSKVLFYGSYNSSYSATLITENILILLLSIRYLQEPLNEHELERLNHIIELLKETVLFSYIKKTERFDLIWDNDSFEEKARFNEKKYLINNLLFYIDKNFELNSAMSILLKFWRENSTTTWPWMKEKFNQI